MVLNHVQGLLNNPSFYCTWFRRALHMVLKPCARPFKQPMVFVHGLGGPCIWFKKHVWGNVVMLVHNKIKNNNKYYTWAINNIKY